MSTDDIRVSEGVGLATTHPVAFYVSSVEAVAALRALGYTVAEAQAALRAAPPASKATTEQRLAAALRGR